MSDARERLARRHSSPAFDAWWELLPQRTGALAERWGLELGEPIPRGNTSLLIRCRRAGEGAVLKLTPEIELAAEEARALRAWGPSGCVPAVWAYEDDALLLEAIEPGTPIRDGPRRDTEELRALLDGLHAAPSDGFPSLAERVEFIYAHWMPRIRGSRRPTGSARWSSPPRTTARRRCCTETCTSATCSTARAASSPSTRGRAPATRTSTPSTSSCGTPPAAARRRRASRSWRPTPSASSAGAQPSSR
jgi:hypothetical protein